MSKLSPVNCIVTSVNASGGKAVVEMQAARSMLKLELAEDSGWLRSLTEGAVVTYSIEVTQLGAPAPDEITTTKKLVSSPDLGPSIVPTEDAELPVTFVTPASDIPPPTLTSENPAVITDSRLANAPIAAVKDALGL